MLLYTVGILSILKYKVAIHLPTGLKLEAIFPIAFSDYTTTEFNCYRLSISADTSTTLGVSTCHTTYQLQMRHFNLFTVFVSAIFYLNQAHICSE